MERAGIFGLKDNSLETCSKGSGRMERLMGRLCIITAQERSERAIEKITCSMESLYIVMSMGGSLNRNGLKGMESLLNPFDLT